MLCRELMIAKAMMIPKINPMNPSKLKRFITRTITNVVMITSLKSVCFDLSIIRKASCKKIVITINEIINANNYKRNNSSELTIGAIFIN